ncbi:MAG: histidinol-phosphate aminotransferase family protein [Chloroflexota bacterium]|nr:histidinol-phosphate aminotransferase family protein [Chloroflexota bacterium]
MAAHASQVYTWEPSNAAIAARYGLSPADILRFDTNTSPFAPDFVRQALGGPFDPPLNEYPDSSYADLTAAAADYFAVAPDEIVVGAGADEVLDLAAKAYLPAGSAALVPVPTYAMYGVLSTQRAARIVAVPRRPADDGFALELPQVCARLADVAVVWLCSPNNPTGAAEAPEAIEEVLRTAAELSEPPLVVVDEAYHEFVGQTVISWRRRYPNLLAVRTLSKAFALPGIRVGFGVGVRDVVARLERVRPPGSISTISAHLAAEALRRPELAGRNVAALATEREWLSAQLAGVGWRPAPSVTNFLLVRIGDHDAAERAAEGLLRVGVVPRTFGPANPLRGHLRLTVRSRTENERLLDAVRRL